METIWGYGSFISAQLLNSTDNAQHPGNTETANWLESHCTDCMDTQQLEYHTYNSSLTPIPEEDPLPDQLPHIPTNISPFSRHIPFSTPPPSLFEASRLCAQGRHHPTDDVRYLFRRLSYKSILIYSPIETESKESHSATRIPRTQREACP